MDLEIAQQIITDSVELGSNIELIWHGGRATFGRKRIFFQAIVALEKEIERENGISFRNRIQTNATLIDKEWIEIFKFGDFGVGVSLDGYENLHNRQRVYAGGKGSFQDVMIGIDRLQKAQIPISILAVLTKESLQRAEEIYDFFLIFRFQTFRFFLPLMELDSKGNKIPGSLDKGDFAGFMGKFFDLWFSRDDSQISIRYFEQILSVLFGSYPSLCKMNGSCQEFITVDHNGDVFPCDNFIGYDNLKYGNLLKQHLRDLLKTKRAIDINISCLLII